MLLSFLFFFFFFFNDTATTEIYTLSLHDALPIRPPRRLLRDRGPAPPRASAQQALARGRDDRALHLPTAPARGGGALPRPRPAAPERRPLRPGGVASLRLVCGERPRLPRLVRARRGARRGGADLARHARATRRVL